jgi:hypothetical protein
LALYAPSININKNASPALFDEGREARNWLDLAALRAFFSFHGGDNNHPKANWQVLTFLPTENGFGNSSQCRIMAPRNTR